MCWILSLISGEAEVMEVAEFRQHFPIENAEFLQREIDVEKIARDIGRSRMVFAIVRR